MYETRREVHFGQRVIHCYKDRANNLNQLWRAAAKRHPDREALVCGQQRISWQQFDDQVMRLAAGLQAQGVGKGDRVALLLANEPEFVLACYASWALGAVIVPVSTREQMPGLSYILNNSGASALFYDAGLHVIVPPQQQTPELKQRIVVGGGYDQTLTFSELLQHTPLPDCVAVHEEDLAAITYTSGTTGLPKGAMLSHFGMVHTIMGYTQILGLDEQVRGAAVVPLSHVTGLAALMAVVLGLGGTLVIIPRFKAEEFLPLAQTEKISYTLMVPAMYQLCLLRDDFSAYDLSAWTVGGFGGAPMPPEVIDQLARHLPHLRLSNCYGATETTSPVAVMPAHLTREHLDSVGLVLPTAEVVVMDGNFRELPPGETGELWHRGPMVVEGYWDNPKATEENFIHGFWRSGDVGCLDAEGYLYVMDRFKDLINRGGYKVFSVEVEKCLTEHHDVIEVAVVGKPCPVLGERVHAFVVLRSGVELTPAELQEFCAQRLADYKVPESFTFELDALPRNANGKLMKRSLRESVAQR
ncbi:acyl--CoA ligase [Alcaligenaceae bacterium]|nr:acyl--CoA ligase [Alcaligenaceae bacterium]